MNRPTADAGRIDDVEFFVDIVCLDLYCDVVIVIDNLRDDFTRVRMTSGSLLMVLVD
jgi:hypothetical protein